jgi:glucose-6-phosphate 1-dehydrogenase
VFVAFKHPPHAVFEDVPTSPANHVRFRLSPDVVIELGARAKRPGDGNVGEEVTLDACRSVMHITPPYQRLLGDALRGDQTLFARTDALDASWRVVDPLLTLDTPVQFYAPGSWGPEAGTRIIPNGGWHDPRA